MSFNRTRMADEAARGFTTATELAAVIHRNTDLDFRSAHHVVGSLVRIAVERGVEPAVVTAELVEEAARLALGREVGLSDEQVRDALDARSFVLAHTSEGGAAPSSVVKNVAHAQERAQELGAGWSAATSRSNRPMRHVLPKSPDWLLARTTQ